MLRLSKHERNGLYALLSMRAICRFITCQWATSLESCGSDKKKLAVAEGSPFPKKRIKLKRSHNYGRT